MDSQDRELQDRGVQDREVKQWKLPWEGGCRCGATRIRLSQPPLLTMACHCAGCRRMSASAFSLSISFPPDGFEVVAGEPVLGGADQNMHYFCPSCLSWMFTRHPEFELWVNVRATMLDEHRWFIPFAEFFTSEKLAWASTPARFSFGTFPPPEEVQPLLRAYAKSGARPQ